MNPFDPISIIKKLENGSPILRWIYRGASVKRGKPFESTLKHILNTQYMIGNNQFYLGSIINQLNFKAESK